MKLQTNSEGSGNMEKIRNNKKFDEDLCINNLKSLEKDFLKTKEYFHNLRGKINKNYIEENFPAFVFQDRYLYIKHPTYRISITESKRIEDITALLQNNLPDVKISYSPKDKPKIDIVCLCENLDSNENVRNKIVKILEKKYIKHNIYADFIYYSIPILIDNDDMIEVQKNYKKWKEEALK